MELYIKKIKRQATCLEIAESLKINIAEVNRKLHNLRYQMNSEFRKIKNKKRVVDVKSSWEFFDALKLMIRFFAIVVDEPDEHTMVLALPEDCTYTHAYIPAFDIKYIEDCFNTKHYQDPTQYVIESSCPIKYSKKEIFDCWFYKKKTWFDFKNVEDIDVQPESKNKLPYTDEEDVAIVNYILEENYTYEVWGKLLWQLIESSKVCKDRTWESLKERYIEHIRYELVPGISKFSFLTPENLNLLQQGLIMNEKRTKSEI